MTSHVDWFLLGLLAGMTFMWGLVHLERLLRRRVFGKCSQCGEPKTKPDRWAGGGV